MNSKLMLFNSRQIDNKLNINPNLKNNVVHQHQTNGYNQTKALRGLRFPS